MVEVHIDYEGQATLPRRSRPVGGLKSLPMLRSTMRDVANRFPPTDLVATAFGTCLLTIIGIVARRKGLEINGAVANVQKVMSNDLPRRIAALPTTISIPLPADHPERAAIESAALTCPVNESLRPDIDRPVTFLWEG